MDPYEILGLKRFCSNEEIKKALHKLAKIHHPDIGGDADKFAEINKAAQILRNSHTRKLFDTYGTVIDLSEEVLHGMIIEKFTDFVNLWVNKQIEASEDIPLQHFLHAHTNSLRQGLDESIRDMERHIKYLKKRKTQISVQEGEENIVVEIMDKKIKAFESTSNKLKRNKVILGMLNDYIDIYDSKEILKVTSGSMFSGTGFYGGLRFDIGA